MTTATPFPPQRSTSGPSEDRNVLPERNPTTGGARVMASQSDQVDPAVGLKLDDFGSHLGITLYRPRAKTREQTMRELVEAMGHTGRGTHCVCGSPLVAINQPPPGVRAEAACWQGWDTAARMWADGWRHDTPMGRTTARLTVPQVEALADTLSRWVRHFRSQWLPVENEVRRLYGKPLLREDGTEAPAQQEQSQPDLFGEAP